jgi:hypothetical protein
VAEIVLGLASSHTPQMRTSAEFWEEHAARDERNTRLLGRDGRYHSYDHLLTNADPGLAGELEAPVWKLAGLAGGDGAALGQLPADMLRSGTSEILNWITAGGALSGLSFDLLDYFPAYRSLAGTGVGMAFATWNRDLAARTEQETAS